MRPPQPTGFGPRPRWTLKRVQGDGSQSEAAPPLVLNLFREPTFRGPASAQARTERVRLQQGPRVLIPLTKLLPPLWTTSTAACPRQTRPSAST